MLLIAACARIYWASNLNVIEKAFNNSRFINAVAIQIKGQTSPGFAEVLYLHKLAVHSVATQSKCVLGRNLMPRLSCSAQTKPYVLRHALR